MEFSKKNYFFSGAFPNDFTSAEEIFPSIPTPISGPKNFFGKILIFQGIFFWWEK
jgi:hypothetical protein